MSHLRQRGVPPGAWPSAVRIPVAWGEMDALGHVNNVAYFRYLETARVAFILELDPQTRAAGHSSAPRFGFILQAAEARFRRPVFFPDELTVTSGVEELGPDRFTLAHELFGRTSEDPVALGRSVIVRYDDSTGRPTALEPGLHKALSARLAPAHHGPPRMKEEKA